MSQTYPSGPYILDFEEKDEAIKAVLDVEYEVLTDALVKRNEYVHRFGHRGHMEAQLNGEFGVLNVLLAPSEEQEANPDRSLEDFVSPADEDPEPEPAPYTSVTILDRDVLHPENSVPQSQSACLVFLSDIARKVAR